MVGACVSDVCARNVSSRLVIDCGNYFEGKRHMRFENTAFAKPHAHD